MEVRAFAHVFDNPDYTVVLEPGDVVRIPALWPHSTVDETGRDSGKVGISVN